MPPDGSLGTATATLVEHRGFDAFGKALDGRWTFENLGRLTLDPTAGPNAYNLGKRNQRGFTGHEHLDEFALIHMNGRAYDYNLGRFLGVDPFIQFPSNSQSLNPYAYLMNNPLSGTDPTGYQICTGTRLKECGARSSSVRLLGDGWGPVKVGGRYLSLSEQRASTLPRIVWAQDLRSPRTRPQIGPGDLGDEELARRADLNEIDDASLAAVPAGGLAPLLPSVAAAVRSGQSTRAGNSGGRRSMYEIRSTQEAVWLTQGIRLEMEIARLQPNRPPVVFIGPPGSPAHNPVTIARLQQEIVAIRLEIRAARHSLNPRVSQQSQFEHTLGHKLYKGGGYFLNPSHPQRALDAFMTGRGDYLGRTPNGHILFRYDGLSGVNVNRGAGFPSQPTDTFMIKGTRTVSIVPTTPYSTWP